MTNQKIENDGLPAWIAESAHRWSVMEQEILGLLTNEDIETDEVLNR